MNARLEIALQYAGLGWCIFPLAPGLKIPMAGTNGFKDATSDIELITRWWARRPDANIGLATGAASGVWVVDIDRKKDKDGAVSLQKFLTDQDTDTPVITKRSTTASGGGHVFFKYDASLPVKSRADVLSGIDIRGDGGYVVLPPSDTSVGTYRWAPGSHELPVAEAPQWAFKLAEYRRGNQPFGSVTNKVDKSKRLPWSMRLSTRRTSDMVLSETVAGRKYVCRCPFHDDRSASAFFKRVDDGFGFLYCSACDTTWITEHKTISGAEADSIAARLAALKQRLEQK